MKGISGEKSYNIYAQKSWQTYANGRPEISRGKPTNKIVADPQIFRGRPAQIADKPVQQPFFLARKHRREGCRKDYATHANNAA